MLDVLFSLFIIAIGALIGNLLGNFIFSYFTTKSLSKSIFSKSDFINVDDDFFSDSKSNSITDIDITNDFTDSTIDSTDNKPKFF